MRRDFVFLALVLGVAAMAAWLLVAQKPSGPTDRQAPPSADESAGAGAVITSMATMPPGEMPKEAEAAAVTAGKGTATLDEAVAETPQAKQEAYAAKRVVELQDLGMEDDPASLETILSELANRDPSIREAAVQAAVQFGSRDAIPKLEDAAAQTDDPEEKATILEAVTFLKLPTLTEALRQQTQPVPDTSAGTRSNP